MEAEQLTTFRDDQYTQEVDPPNHTASWYEWSGTAPSESDVKAILARPRPVWNGNFTSTSTISQAYDLPKIWINTSNNLKAKLVNYTFMKGTLVAKLVANASPFQCGKYWMYYVPYSAECLRYPFTEDITHITGYPGIELDLASAKSAELRIPLVGPYNMVNLANKIGKYGDLFIRELVQISDGTSAASCGATLYMWMEDAELSMPTSSKNLFAQSKDESKTASKSGLISGFSSKIGALADSVGSAFPSLSAYTAPLSWASGVVTGVASYFGFSKPTSLETSTAVYNVPGKGFTNGSGVDCGVVLGTFPDNAIDQSVNPMGTDVDEMSLSYVTRRPCVHSVFYWKNDQTVNEKLYTTEVRPLVDSYSGSNSCPTIMEYVSAFFRYWGGSITYKISFAKTAFHSGRIRIQYEPDPNSDVEFLDDVYKWIVDLSTTSEITLTIPYVSNRPWTRVEDMNGHLSIYVQNPLNVSSESAANQITALVWKCGGPDYRLAIPDRYITTSDWPTQDERRYVKPNLRAQIHVETDAPEHQSIEGNKLMPYEFTDPIQACKASMGESVVSLRTLAKRFTALAKVVPPFVYNSTEDVGHYLFPSVKNCPIGLSMHPYYFGNDLSDKYVSGRLDNTSKVDDLTNPGVFLRHYQSMLGAISQIYRFARGSVRFKYVAASPSSQQFGYHNRPVLRAVLDENSAEPTSVTILVENMNTQNEDVLNYKNRFNHVVQSDNGVLEVTVPQYTETPCVVTSNSKVVNDYGRLVSGLRLKILSSDGMTPNNAVNHVQDGSGEQYNYTHSALSFFPPGHLLQAAGDDFSFSFLGGAPPYVRGS